MANKKWRYVVSYQSPEDADLTPSKRKEETCIVEATTAPRAISKAKDEILEEWEGVKARDLVILDVCRTDRYKGDEA